MKGNREMIACGHEKPPTWIDEKYIAVGGIGKDDILMIDGARIFDITLPAESTGTGWACELNVFPGPAGAFFSNGTLLFSSGETGLSRWDLTDGAQTGQIPNFRPTRHHRGSNELLQLIDSTIVRWKIS